MTGGRRTHAGEDVQSADGSVPPITACRSRPGKLVFIESGNTDGWIATDGAVELSP